MMTVEKLFFFQGITNRKTIYLQNSCSLVREMFVQNISRLTWIATEKITIPHTVFKRCTDISNYRAACIISLLFLTNSSLLLSWACLMLSSAKRWCKNIFNLLSSRNLQCSREFISMVKGRCKKENNWAKRSAAQKKIFMKSIKPVLFIWRAYIFD